MKNILLKHLIRTGSQSPLIAIVGATSIPTVAVLSCLTWLENNLFFFWGGKSVPVYEMWVKEIYCIESNVTVII